MRKERSRRPRRKVCNFCVDHIDEIDYKDTAKLRRLQLNEVKFYPVVYPAFAQTST